MINFTSHNNFPFLNNFYAENNTDNNTSSHHSAQDIGSYTISRPCKHFAAFIFQLQFSQLRLKLSRGLAAVFSWRVWRCALVPYGLKTYLFCIGFRNLRDWTLGTDWGRATHMWLTRIESWFERVKQLPVSGSKALVTKCEQKRVEGRIEVAEHH